MNDDRMTKEQKDNLKRAAEFRMGYLRWLAAKLAAPGPVDRLIRDDSARAILQLMGEPE